MEIGLNKIAFIVGIILTTVGFYLWYVTPMGTKLFQLSNDIVGAGLASFTLGIVLTVISGTIGIIRLIKK